MTQLEFQSHHMSSAVADWIFWVLALAGLRPGSVKGILQSSVLVFIAGLTARMNGSPRPTLTEPVLAGRTFIRFPGQRRRLLEDEPGRGGHLCSHVLACSQGIGHVVALFLFQGVPVCCVAVSPGRTSRV